MEILIAKILCVAYLSLSWGIIAKRTYYRNVFIKLVDNSTVMLIGGFVAIALGFVIIEFHNTWIWDWTTIYTIIGWISLIKGIVLLACPNLTSFYKRIIFESDNFSRILLPVLFIIGLVFGYFGFIY